MGYTIDSTILPLIDAEIRNTKPADTNVKLIDTKGLYLLIKTTGGKLWRLKYQYDGIKKSVTLGTYPSLSLSEARAVCDQHHMDIANGIDPSLRRKEKIAKEKTRLANTLSDDIPK
jgi:hypothetical protein